LGTALARMLHQFTTAKARQGVLLGRRSSELVQHAG
jgi:hypothetical protein